MGNTVTLGQNDFSSLACNDNSEPKQPHQFSGRRNIEQTVDGGILQKLFGNLHDLTRMVAFSSLGGPVNCRKWLNHIKTGKPHYV